MTSFVIAGTSTSTSTATPAMCLLAAQNSDSNNDVSKKNYGDSAGGDSARNDDSISLSATISQLNPVQLRTMHQKARAYALSVATTAAAATAATTASTTAATTAATTATATATATTHTPSVAHNNEVLIKVPHRHDVLLGRGNTIHNGNGIYRSLVREHCTDFCVKYKGVGMDNRQQKLNIVQSVWTKIKAQNPPGRFLVGNNNAWYEPSKEVACDKIKTALYNAGASVVAKHNAINASMTVRQQEQSMDEVVEEPARTVTGVESDQKLNRSFPPPSSSFVAKEKATAASIPSSLSNAPDDSFKSQSVRNVSK
jgi:hypothetical protein